MHEINVSVISPQEAHDSVAEFWSGGRLIGFTHIADGDLMLQLEPHHDGSAVLLGSMAGSTPLLRPTACSRRTERVPAERESLPPTRTRIHTERKTARSN